MTRPSQILAILSFVAFTATGCSTLSGGRSGPANRWRTMASNGGTALPTETGPPEARVAAELGEPETASRAEGKISGRVLDPKGRPVPNAEVRLADGSSRIGRDLRATTDDAGGFTIRGLRPGASYMLIAEGDDGRDALVGRASARAPSGNVRILLAQDDADPTPKTAEADNTEETSPRQRVGRISDRKDVEEDDDPFAARKPALNVNEADLPPADEAPSNDPSAPAEPISEPAPIKNPNAGWRRQTTESDAPASSKIAEERPAAKQVPKPIDDEGPNPLPPAKEKQVEPLSPPLSKPEPMNNPAPASIPDPTNDTPIVPNSLVPPDMTRTPDAPPSSLPVDSAAIPAEATPRRRATWGDVIAPTTAEPAKVAIGTSLPLSTRRLPDREAQVDAATLEANRMAESKKNRFGFMALKGRNENDAETRVPAIAASCQFDTRTGRIIDFTLPDLDGKPTNFRDLDADYVLIDFWGSWCKPCIESIPHLVQLQSKYGPKTLRVIGVAYEQEASPSEKIKRVDKVARSLGVNYPLLLSEADGKPCPLQQALNIQKYPTMILVDRSGKIVWRDTGAEGSTLSRLDRVIAAKADTGAVRR